MNIKFNTITTLIAVILGVSKIYAQEVMNNKCKSSNYNPTEILNPMKLINTIGNPKPINIDINKSKNGGYILEDHIRVIAVPKKYNKPRFIIQQKGTWWKALVMFDTRTPYNWSEIVCLQDNRKKSANYIDSDFVGYKVTISEAKTIGVHTNMYEIKNLDKLGRDHDWYFNWE